MSRVETLFECSICDGLVSSVSYGGERNGCQIGEHMARDRICFECHYWTCFLSGHVAAEPSNQVVAKGVHYFIQPDQRDKTSAGFGGRGFRIRFHDGREVVTHNLWHQGNVPDRFRDRYPDNAEFIGG